MRPRFERITSSTSVLLKLEQVLVRALPRSVHLLVLCRIASQNGFPSGVDIQFFRYTESETASETVWWENKDDSKLFIVCIERPNISKALSILKTQIHTKKGIILLPPPIPTPEMAEAFDDLVGWSEPQVFQCVQPSFWVHLQTMCTTHKNLKPENSVGIPGVMHAILDVDTAKKFDVTIADKNLRIRHLDERDVPEVVKNWKWRAPHSEQMIRTCIKKFTSCGLFLHEDGKTEEMASSVLLSPLGVFNVLYTPEIHRRKGYGKIVMKWIAKQAALQLGIPPMAEIEIWNDASKKLLENVGFVEVYKTRWFYYDPPQ